MENIPAPSSANPRRLLVVENQPGISRLLQPARDGWSGGVDFLHAPSAEEALLFGSLTRIDLLIAEYQLPGMNGIQLMHKLRQKQPGVKVILVGRASDPAEREAVSSAGADARFFKPLQEADFLASVDLLLALPAPMPVKAPAPGQTSPPPTLSSLLGDLRLQLKSQALLLINTHGEVLGRAGDLPDVEAEGAFLASLLSIHSAGEKISHLLEQDEYSAWSVFDQGKYDLVFVPLGAEHALLALGEDLVAEKQFMETMAALRLSRAPILSLLYENIEPIPSGVPGPGQEPSLPSNGDLKNGSLESLLDSLEKLPQPGEADEFWDAAVNEQASPVDPDTISYDQARKLGLTPGEDS